MIDGRPTSGKRRGGSGGVEKRERGKGKLTVTLLLLRLPHRWFPNPKRQRLLDRRPLVHVESLFSSSNN
jgi:hypothetical protein